MFLIVLDFGSHPKPADNCQKREPPRSSPQSPIVLIHVVTKSLEIKSFISPVQSIVECGASRQSFAHVVIFFYLIFNKTVHEFHYHCIQCCASDMPTIAEQCKVEYKYPKQTGIWTSSNELERLTPNQLGHRSVKIVVVVFEFRI